MKYIKETKEQKLKKILCDSNQTSFRKAMPIEEYNTNVVNRLKTMFKKNIFLYELLISIISPVYTLTHAKNLKNLFINNLDNIQDKIVINLGSGNSLIHEDVINIDIFDYKNVDYVCDIYNLPFKDGSVDCIINIAVLEHVPYPQQVVNEIYRVLKPNGIVFSTIPFIQGFHASPYDYQRYTIEGIKILHQAFTPMKILVSGGPTSGFLWIFQEWLAIIFSFGSKRLHLFLSLLLMILTFPLKFLDLLWQYHPCASNISTAFTYIGIKSSENK